MVPDNIVYSNTLPSYNALVVVAFQHFRINYSKSFVKGQTDINGIEKFWNHTDIKYAISTTFLYTISFYFSKMDGGSIRNRLEKC